MKRMLSPRLTPLASIENTSDKWRLQIPAGKGGIYRLAQVDDYHMIKRKDFPYFEQGSLSLRCRASSANHPGTWGFGFWNDPFTFTLRLQADERRLPTLPNACWFFNASPENHLTFQNHLPGCGFLAQTFRSPKVPFMLLLPGLIGAPLLLSKHLSRFMRHLTGKISAMDGMALDLDLDTTQWHTYRIDWQLGAVIFCVDELKVFETRITPRGPLGTVIWIDNQYAAWTPEGRIRSGTLENKSAGWIDIEDLVINGVNSKISSVTGNVKENK